MDTSQKDEFLITQIIFMFQAAALQQMGKLKSPLSDKVERDLNQAQISIDILDVLHRKMKGNLTMEEDKMFTQVLQELRLNYVDEAAKKEPQPEPAPPNPPTNS
ncbi:MAG: DUF1844 domain-containing protein [Bacteroidota bacterium]